MRDFPVFTTKNGVASIVLREVPYKGIAYITLRDSLEPAALLQECIDFCKVAGAEKIYATGHKILQKYPFYTTIIKMQQQKAALVQTDAALFPVTENTAQHWKDIYNEKMRQVPNASTMTQEDMKSLLSQGGGYFVHREGKLLGIGIARGEQIEAIVSCEPGAGETVLLSLCGALFSEDITVEVAVSNAPAVALYRRLGFVEVQELSRWYHVGK